MATTDKAQYWRYTLNNHTTAEMTLIRDPPASVGIVHHVFTPEQGENGTPHIQGYIKLNRQVRMSHLKRHWLDRANYGALKDTEYKANTLKYVQKQDATARAPTTQAHNPTPLLYPGMIPQLIMQWVHEHTNDHYDNLNERYDTHMRRWVRDTTGTAEDFAAWVDRQTDRHEHHKYDTRHEEHTWRGRMFMPSHEAPMTLVIEYAKSQLVRQYQCETMVNKPDVVTALTRYWREILWRIEHTHAPTEEDEGARPEVREEGTPPPAPQGTDAP